VRASVRGDGEAIFWHYSNIIRQGIPGVKAATLQGQKSQLFAHFLRNAFSYKTLLCNEALKLLRPERNIAKQFS
jgi:hypothetical protein